MNTEREPNTSDQDSSKAADKIASLDLFGARISKNIEFLFLKVVTSDGVAGWGEATLNGMESQIAAAISDFRQKYVGLPTAAAMAGLRREPAWKNGRVFRVALHAVEQALVDIKARRLDVPAFELLGGRMRDAIPYYANINRGAKDRSAQGWAERASQAASQGFAAIKFVPFDNVTPDIAIHRLSIIDDGIAKIEAVRQALGDHVKIMVDCHWCFDEAGARHFIQRVAPLNLHWIEAPTLEEPVNQAGLRRIRELANDHGILLAGGEFLQGQAEYVPVLTDTIYDVINPDVRFCGVYGTRTITELAATLGMRVSPHNHLGPIMDAASAHICIAAPAVYTIETQFEEADAAKRFFKNPPQMTADGLRLVDDQPGWGIEPDEDLLSEIL